MNTSLRAIAVAFAFSIACASTAFAAAALDTDPKTFIETVYGRYADGTVTSPNWQMDIWDSQMLALMAEDQRLSPEGNYVLDWDPLCQCQDFEKLRATVSVTMISATTATATVDFIDNAMSDAHPSHATLDLVKERGHWRIHDIHSKDFENPTHSMRERFIKANGERQGHH